MRVERGKKQTGTPGRLQKEEKSQQHMALKIRGAEFRDCLPPVELKAWNFIIFF